MILESASKIGIDGRAASSFSGKLRDQGFINIREEKAMWAVGSWPRGKREKIIGQWTQENMLQGVQGISLALFTRRLGMSREAVELFLVDVRKDIKNPKAHVYCQMWVSLLSLTPCSYFSKAIMLDVYCTCSVFSPKRAIFLISMLTMFG